MKSKLKKISLTGLKLAFAFGLVYWMIAAGKLDLKELKVIIHQPFVLSYIILLWTICFLLLGCARWYVLLRGVGLKVEFFRALQMHAIGFFFNSAMPGAVGGDIIKAVYVMRDNNTQSKTSALLTVLLDRIMGILGIFMIGGIAMAFDLMKLWNNPLTKPAVIFVYALLFSLLAFFATVFIPFKEGRDPFLWILNRKVPGFSIFKKIYLALRCYHHRPRALFTALLISIAIQIPAMCLFYLLTVTMTGQHPDIGSLATILPIGILTTALPIAPGGIGVGHVAFDKLYELIGLTGGANIFNVYCLSIIALNMLGMIPYVFFRSKINLAELEQGDLA